MGLSLSLVNAIGVVNGKPSPRKPPKRKTDMDYVNRMMNTKDEEALRKLIEAEKDATVVSESPFKRKAKHRPRKKGRIAEEIDRQIAELRKGLQHE
jgi:hypothetical protein